MDAAPELPREAWDLVVIGAGIGGLACAALAADAGLKVLVLERHGKPGGYAQFFGKAPTFDSTTFYFPGCGPGGPVDRLLGPLGLGERVARVPVDPAFRFVFPEHDLLVRPSAAGAPPALTAAFPRQANGLDQAAATLDALGRAVAEGERDVPLLQQHDRHSAHEVFAACGVDARAEAVAGGLWPLLGVPPSRADVLAFALQWHLAFGQPIHAIRGGAKAFSAALRGLIEERGGRVVLRAPVARILVESGRAAGVVLANGAVVRAGAVVSNADPYQTFLELGQGAFVDEGVRRRLDAWRPSPSAVVLHLSVSRTIESPAQVTVLHAGYAPEEELEDAWAQEPGFPAAVVGVPTWSDPDRHPGGGMVFAMALAAYDRPDEWHVPHELRRDKAYRALEEYRASKEALGDRLLARVRKVLPRLPDDLQERRVATPITLERYTFSHRGAAFGWESTPQQSLLAYPGPHTPLSGLYQCGQWTYPGHGVAAAVLSGGFAVRALLEGT